MLFIKSGQKFTNSFLQIRAKILADDKLKYSFLLQTVSMETISMKCQVLFSGEKKKENIINLSSAEFALGVIKAKKKTYLMN